MDPTSNLTQYLLSLLKIEMPEPEPYLFDKDCLVLPAALKQSLPSDVIQAFVHARWAASNALRYIKVVEKNYNKRYNAMCPLNSPEQSLAHIDSISRIMAWKSDHNNHYNSSNSGNSNPTSAPTNKIDPSTLNIYVDQRTYDEFAWNYVQLLERFIEEPYRLWLEAKADVNSRVANANLDEMEYSYWHRFWDLTFLVEMQKWEGRIRGLVLPSWEEMIHHLRQLILEYVDSPHIVLKDIYDRSGILWKKK